MRHLRFAVVVAVAVATLAVMPAGRLGAMPGAGGTVIFSVVGIDPVHDVSAGVVPPGVTCTSADILAAPGAGPVGPCMPRVAPAPPGPVPWGVTGAVVDLGLNFGGPFTDDLEDFSFGEVLGVEVSDYGFSVDPAPANGGVTTGAPITPPCAPFAPNVTTEAGALEAQGDVFTNGGVPVGCNVQFTDEAALGLIAPDPGYPPAAPLDDVDALGEFTFTGGPCTVVASTFATMCAAYTVTAGSPVLGGIPPDALSAAPVTGGTILAQPGTLAAPPAMPAGCPAGGLPCAAVGFPTLGLALADDIDALCWFDAPPIGVPNIPLGALGPGSLGDIYLFSLTPGSPSAPALGGAASIIRVGGSTAAPSVAVAAGTLGLLPSDDLDALICHDVDGDGDFVPDSLDNCPTVANPNQANVDLDGLGDACDTEGPSPNANGLGGADDCTDGVDNDADGFIDGADTGCGDSDGDGYTDEIEAGVPICLGMVNDDNADDPNINDGCPAVGAPEVACANALDDDADGRVNDGCIAVGALSEGAFNAGTNPVGPCNVGAGPDPSPSWPSDFVSGSVPNSTDRITIVDLTSFLAPIRRLGTSPGVVPPPGSAFSSRYDLVPGRGVLATWIAIDDLTALLGGASGNPPMFGGLRAFNGPACVGP